MPAGPAVTEFAPTSRCRRRLAGRWSRLRLYTGTALAHGPLVAPSTRSCGRAGSRAISRTCRQYPILRLAHGPLVAPGAGSRAVSHACCQDPVLRHAAVNCASRCQCPVPVLAHGPQSLYAAQARRPLVGRAFRQYPSPVLAHRPLIAPREMPCSSARLWG